MSRLTRNSLNYLFIFVAAVSIYLTLSTWNDHRSDVSKRFIENFSENSFLTMKKNSKAEDTKNFVPFKELIKGQNKIEQDDPRLIKVIQQEFLRPPSTKKYRFRHHKEGNSDWTVVEFNELIPNKKNGFFIECGAFDGSHSNTINFERHSGWNGLLIEPDPIFFKSLLTIHRKSWLVNACLSPTGHPSEVNFQRNGWGSAIERFSHQEDKSQIVRVKCLPLFSILMAMNVTKIDYFSLDVEGVEFQVLKTIPWDKVNISVIAMEMQFLTSDETKELEEFMGNMGYKKILRRIEYFFYHPKLLF